jgi:hypothetical protein
MYICTTQITKYTGYVDGSNAETAYQRGSSEGSGYGSTSTDTKPIVDLDSESSALPHMSRFDISEGSPDVREALGGLWGDAGDKGGRDFMYVDDGAHARNRSYGYGIYKVCDDASTYSCMYAHEVRIFTYIFDLRCVYILP